MGKKVYVSKQDRVRCPTVNCVFNIHDNEGVNILTKLHLQFSALNEHRCRHRFNATGPCCKCGTTNENNKHFLLHCPLYNDIRLNLHDEISEILDLDTVNLGDDFLRLLLLCGDDEVPLIMNKTILEATIKYIKSSKRFKSVNQGN